MRCLACGGETNVKDSRLQSARNVVRRTRVCREAACGYRFYTLETQSLRDFRVRKRDGRRERFNLEKLRVALAAALGGNDSRLAASAKDKSAEDLASVMDEVLVQLRKHSDIEIGSDRLAEIVMDVLRTRDQRAFVRYAADYYFFELGAERPRKPAPRDVQLVQLELFREADLP